VGRVVVNYYKSAFIGIALVFVGFVAGGFLATKYYSKPVQITEITPAKTDWVKPVRDLSPAELYDCTASPIEIICTVENNNVRVIASDTCKSARALWRINTPVYNHMIDASIGILYHNGFARYVQAVYYHRIGFLYVGGGVLVGDSLAGVQAGVRYLF
jgi:hypothetical protein